MPVADTVILSQLQRVTIEHAGDGGVSWPSGMWTLAEVAGYLTQRQNRLLTAIALIWTRTETAITTGQTNQPMPSSWTRTILVAYKTSAGAYRELPRMDTYELDAIASTWPGSTSASPIGYREDAETLITHVIPAPSDVGSALERYYIALGSALTGAGVNFTVPDEFIPTVKYGALAEMFLKVGPAQNLSLAAACEARWREGLELGMLIQQDGWLQG